MADGQAPGPDGGQQGGQQAGDFAAALAALQAAAASVQASVRAAEAVKAALQPMVGALELAHERRRSEGGESAGVQSPGELLLRSVENLERQLPQEGEATAAVEQASRPTGGRASVEGLRLASNAASPAVAAAVAAGVAEAQRNWRYEDEQAYNAWAAAHPAEASIDAVWEPADVVATGTGSQGPVYLVSWKGWESEAAVRSWHTADDLRRYNWRPALLERRAAGKPHRGVVAGM
ncbi:hypothetical protein COHA_007369 [Chlorella ohadii]|uniref:Chromo domain-containing protein n=1 Tax=Chlorella ohadii TaxID=2649997 RepID=A0AAD5DLY7_9CHLO|nr:hypothetical protein COHA_007369 [Chlorella ohadii]